VNQFTVPRCGARYGSGAGDLRGPVEGAAGTRVFEPDGVTYWTYLALRIAGGGVTQPAAGWALGRSAARLLFRL
jgi:hypothetical protein